MGQWLESFKREQSVRMLILYARLIEATCGMCSAKRFDIVSKWHNWRIKELKKKG